MATIICASRRRLASCFNLTSGVKFLNLAAYPWAGTKAHTTLLRGFHNLLRT